MEKTHWDQVSSYKRNSKLHKPETNKPTRYKTKKTINLTSFRYKPESNQREKISLRSSEIENPEKSRLLEMVEGLVSVRTSRKIAGGRRSYERIR